MRWRSGTEKPSVEKVVKDIRRRTRKRHSAEEKIRIVLHSLRGEKSIAELCLREGVGTSLYYSWSKEFLEAGKKRPAGDTTRAVPSTDTRCYFVSETSVCNLLKAYDLVTSPAFAVISAADARLGFALCLANLSSR